MLKSIYFSERSRLYDFILYIDKIFSFLMFSKLFLPYIIKRKNSKNDLTYEKEFFLFIFISPFSPRQHPKCPLSILNAPICWEPAPCGGGRTGMGAGGSPCRSGRISGDSPPAQDCRGYRLHPRVGRRGDCLLAIYLLAICCLILVIIR